MGRQEMTGKGTLTQLFQLESDNRAPVPRDNQYAKKKVYPSSWFGRLWAVALGPVLLWSCIRVGVCGTVEWITS